MQRRALDFSHFFGFLLPPPKVATGKGRYGEPGRQSTHALACNHHGGRQIAAAGMHDYLASR